MAHDLHVSLQQLTNCISRITNKPVGEALSLSELGGSVVRAAPDGRIIDAGTGTRVVLARHKLASAQDVIGGSLWKKILELQRTGEHLPRETLVHVDALNDSFFVAHSPAADGAVNIYLTEAEPRVSQAV